MYDLWLILLHVGNTDADGTLVRLQALHSGEGLNRLGETKQAISGQVRAGNVLQEGAEVDTRVLLGVAVGS